MVAMTAKPQSFRELARQMRENRAHTYASENADHYRGFDAGQLRAAEAIERACDAWEQHFEDVGRCTITGVGFVLSYLLGEPTP